MDDRINVNKEDGILEIPIENLDDFQLQNVSQGRISIESDVRKKIGIEKDGQVLVTHLSGNFFVGKALNQEEIDEIARNDLNIK